MYGPVKTSLAKLKLLLVQTKEDKEGRVSVLASLQVISKVIVGSTNRIRSSRSNKTQDLRRRIRGPRVEYTGFLGVRPGASGSTKSRRIRTEEY